MSAAFDTVNHETLLDVLQTQFGLNDSALRWHKSYLAVAERTYRVVTGEAESNITELDYGLPQGSSL